MYLSKDASSELKLIELTMWGSPCNLRSPIFLNQWLSGVVSQSIVWYEMGFMVRYMVVKVKLENFMHKIDLWVASLWFKIDVVTGHVNRGRFPYGKGDFLGFLNKSSQIISMD